MIKCPGRLKVSKVNVKLSKKSYIMLRVYNYDITFKDVPNEVSLSLAIMGCPHHCDGCSSPWLRDNYGGHILNTTYIDILLSKYSDVTCVTFLGGDADRHAIEDLGVYVKSLGYKSCWYSGGDDFPKEGSFDYIKLGGYVKSLGALESKTTNQHFYEFKDGRVNDVTYKFWK